MECANITQINVQKMCELDLSPLQLDALREMGNVGAGNAATALGQLLNKTVNIDIPRVKLFYLEKADDSRLSPDPQEVSLAIYSRLLGELKGGAMAIFSKKSGLLLSDILLKRDSGNTELLTLVELSALSETAYILCCSYLDSVGTMLNHRLLIPAAPQTAIDKLNSLSQALIKKFLGEKIKYVISIENIMTIDGARIDLFVTFLLEQESVSKVFGMLGI